MVDLFEQDQVLSSTTADIFVLLSSHDTTEFNLTTLNCSEFLLSLVNASEFDLAKFTNAYQAFCFAFPNRQSQFIENRKELLRQLLMISLPGKKLWRLNHPYPLPIQEFITDMIMPGRLNS